MPDLQLVRTTSEHPDFQSLVGALDQDLALKNGASNDFYAQFNKIDLLKNVVLGYSDGQAVACGAFKEYDPASVEIKRMYVTPNARGKRFGALVLKELENWARELHYTACVLETGTNNPQAIRLYRREGYAIIPNYGQYQDADNSVCMSRTLAGH